MCCDGRNKFYFHFTQDSPEGSSSTGLGISFYELSFNGVLVASPDGDTLGLARALLLGAAEQALVGVDAAVTPALGIQVLGAAAGEAVCIQIPSAPILFPLLFSLGSFREMKIIKYPYTCLH